jgi:hypothetical protein
MALDDQAGSLGPPSPPPPRPPSPPPSLDTSSIDPEATDVLPVRAVALSPHPSSCCVNHQPIQSIAQHQIHLNQKNSFPFFFCVCGRTKSGAAFLLDGFYTYLNISVYTKDFSMQGESINGRRLFHKQKIAREYLNLIENIQKFE